MLAFHKYFPWRLNGPTVNMALLCFSIWHFPLVGSFTDYTENIDEQRKVDPVQNTLENKERNSPVPAAKSSHLRRGWAMVAQLAPLTDLIQAYSLLLTPQLRCGRCLGIWWMLRRNESSEFLLLRSNNGWLMSGGAWGHLFKGGQIYGREPAFQLIDVRTAYEWTSRKLFIRSGF